MGSMKDIAAMDDHELTAKVEQAVGKDFLSPVIQRHPGGIGAPGDSMAENTYDSMMDTHPHGQNTEYLLRRIRSALHPEGVEEMGVEAMGVERGDRESIASARENIDELILSNGASVHPSAQKAPAVYAGSRHTTATKASHTPSLHIMNGATTNPASTVKDTTHLKGGEEHVVHAVGTSFVSEMDHSGYTHTVGTQRVKEKPRHPTGSPFIAIKDQSTLHHTLASLLPPPASVTNVKPTTGSISGSVVSGNYSNLTASNVKVVENKKGVFFRKQSAHFGSIAVGGLARAKIELCNATDDDRTVFLGDPALPFVLCHNEIKLRARSYVRLPIRFVPTSRADFETELVMQSSDGCHHSSIRLCGTAH